MKGLFLFIVLMTSGYSISQNSSEATVEYKKLCYSESVSIKNVRLEFKKLSADSRCPKEVMCVRAGEAIVTVKVFVNNSFKEELQLTFYPHGVSEKLSQVLEKENILIENLQLFPYPKADLNQINSNYYLQFNVLASKGE